MAHRAPEPRSLRWYSVAPLLLPICALVALATGLFPIALVMRSNVTLIVAGLLLGLGASALIAFVGRSKLGFGQVLADLLHLAWGKEGSGLSTWRQRSADTGGTEPARDTGLHVADLLLSVLVLVLAGYAWAKGPAAAPYVAVAGLTRAKQRRIKSRLVLGRGSGTLILNHAELLRDPGNQFGNARACRGTVICQGDGGAEKLLDSGVIENRRAIQRQGQVAQVCAVVRGFGSPGPDRISRPTPRSGSSRRSVAVP